MKSQTLAKKFLTLKKWQYLSLVLVLLIGLIAVFHDGKFDPWVWETYVVCDDGTKQIVDTSTDGYYCMNYFYDSKSGNMYMGGKPQTNDFNIDLNIKND